MADEEKVIRVRRGNKGRIYVALEPEFLKRLKEMSRETGISLSGLVRMAVHEWLGSRSIEGEG